MKLGNIVAPTHLDTTPEALKADVTVSPVRTMPKPKRLDIRGMSADQLAELERLADRIRHPANACTHPHPPRCRR